MRFSFLFKWYDFWVGFFYDSKKNWIYFLPIPCLGIIIKLPQKRHYLYSAGIDAIVGSTVTSELYHENRSDRYTPISYWAVNGTTQPLFKSKRKIIIDYEKEVNG